MMAIGLCYTRDLSFCKWKEHSSTFLTIATMVEANASIQATPDSILGN